MPDWETLAEGFRRLEAPCVDADGNLFFAEREDPGTVLRLGTDGSVTSVVERFPSIGGIAIHADGGLVVAGRTVSLFRDGHETVVMEPSGGWGFNDLTTDEAGRVYVGMHGEAPSATSPDVKASLWRIDPGGKSTWCYGDVEMTNGLALSADGKYLYHNDTIRKLVFVSDVGEEGELTGRRPFFQLSEGTPDGMGIDADGYVWLALIGMGKLIRIAPDGTQDRFVEVPMPWVTSLCFGGSDGRDLYVTTFGAPYDPAHTGSILRTRVDVPGPIRPPARV